MFSCPVKINGAGMTCRCSSIAAGRSRRRPTKSSGFVQKKQKSACRVKKAEPGRVGVGSRDGREDEVSAVSIVGWGMVADVRTNNDTFQHVLLNSTNSDGL